jgi:RNA polymerase sigma-54 factor
VRAETAGAVEPFRRVVVAADLDLHPLHAALAALGEDGLEPAARDAAASMGGLHVQVVEAGVEAADFHAESQGRHAVAGDLAIDARPGQSINTSEPEYVIPDVLVRKTGTRWTVELNADSLPRLKINQHYAAMGGSARNDSDSQFIRSNLQEARWLIKSLESRNDTLLKVTRCIVEQQQAFFEQGEEYMRPMVLADIAQAVDMHESTISRVTTQKYLHSPRGIFELKYFFSSHVSTEGGGEASSTAIRALVKKLISAENPAKPLSDSKLTSMLSEQGIMVARRTVAKYRESLSIPPSNQRKQLV